MSYFAALVAGNNSKAVFIYMPGPVALCTFEVTTTVVISVSVLVTFVKISVSISLVRTRTAAVAAVR